MRPPLAGDHELEAVKVAEVFPGGLHGELLDEWGRSEFLGKTVGLTRLAQSGGSRGARDVHFEGGQLELLEPNGLAGEVKTLDEHTVVVKDVNNDSGFTVLGVISVVDGDHAADLDVRLEYHSGSIYCRALPKQSRRTFSREIQNLIRRVAYNYPPHQIINCRVY